MGQKAQIMPEKITGRSQSVPVQLPPGVFSKMAKIQTAKRGPNLSSAIRKSEAFD